MHLAAAVPNFAWLEVRVSPTEPGRFSDPDIFPLQPVQDGSRLLVSDKPGLGVDVNEELVQKQTFAYWEAPHLRRRDGSYTNW